MSLLRRREMMAGQEQEENVIYIDAGFLEQGTSTAFSDPTYNQQYKNAWSSTCISADAGDVIHCDSVVASYDQRTRMYLSDGSYDSFYMFFDLTVSKTGYIRFMDVGGAGTLNGVIVNRIDGNVDIYKVIDRR